MTFKSPLGRIATRSSTAEARKPIIPEKLRLPDGREFVTADLLRQVRERQNYNLRGRNPRRALAHRPPPKYTVEDHKWILQATVEEIQQRYGVNQTYARQLRYRAERFKHLL